VVAAWACALRYRASAVALVAGAALLVAELRIRDQGTPQGILRATFLDVGQGDGAILDLPDGRAIVVDGGGLVGLQGPSVPDFGLRVLGPVLRARRRRAIALAILSHPHPDHFGGLAGGLASVRLDEVWDTGQGEREGVAGAYAQLLARASSVPGGTLLRRPPAICGARELGGVRLDVLAPCPGPDPFRGPNDNSIAFRVQFGGRAILFVGDAEAAEEADLLRDPARLRADVLKVGHHGSRTSSSSAFLAAVAPDQAVISVGIRNRFGHPSAQTLAALAARGARTWRTDRDGAVVVTTDGRNLTVTAANPGGERSRTETLDNDPRAAAERPP
jgi:competence protein ComEC